MNLVSITFPDLHLHQDRVKVIRLTMNLFFGNCEALKEIFYQILPKRKTKLKVILVDAAGEWWWWWW